MPLPFHKRVIVLTGGPCAGKTTVARLLSRAFAETIDTIPESASLLVQGGFPRWTEPECRCAFQTAVFRVQRELERTYLAHSKKRILLLDRGTLDGAVYWPEGPPSFFKAMGTTQESEMARYDRVIYLESAPPKAYQTYFNQNPVRKEDWEQASNLDTQIRTLWSQHPAAVLIQNEGTFVDKVLKVLALIEGELSKSSSE